MVMLSIHLRPSQLAFNKNFPPGLRTCFKSASVDQVRILKRWLVEFRLVRSPALKCFKCSH